MLWKELKDLSSSKKNVTEHKQKTNSSDVGRQMGGCEKETFWRISSLYLFILESVTVLSIQKYIMKLKLKIEMRCNKISKGILLDHYSL